MYSSFTGSRRHITLPTLTLDATERFLVGVFLRRYVTWYVRRRRATSANEAARLYRRVVAR